MTKHLNLWRTLSFKQPMEDREYCCVILSSGFGMAFEIMSSQVVVVFCTRLQQDQARKKNLNLCEPHPSVSSSLAESPQREHPSSPPHGVHTWMLLTSTSNSRLSSSAAVSPSCLYTLEAFLITSVSRMLFKSKVYPKYLQC